MDSHMLEGGKAEVDEGACELNAFGENWCYLFPATHLIPAKKGPINLYFFCLPFEKSSPPKRYIQAARIYCYSTLTLRCRSSLVQSAMISGSWGSFSSRLE